MHNLRLIEFASILITCAACSSGSTTPFGFCTAAQTFAVEVSVRDSLTGAGLADSASGTVSTTSYQDSLRHLADVDTLLFGGNQLGSYTVVIKHPGYVDWTRTGVKVSRLGTCGNVVSVELAARLVRAP